MNVIEDTDLAAARIASAIGEPARARMLYCLLDGRARTSTELAMFAGVTPATASVHLNRLKLQHLVHRRIQGKHRYYTLAGPEVARVLEGLSILAGGSRSNFVPTTPGHLLAARTCYDHMAGTLGVLLHDRMMSMDWLSKPSKRNEVSYDVTPVGDKALQKIGIDIESTRKLRRRFAFGCLDWSERRAHIGGALGAAILASALRRRWVAQDYDSRALSVTATGRRELLNHFGLKL
jgi:DNA-binding transcriptional ArsR family regulator